MGASRSVRLGATVLGLLVLLNVWSCLLAHYTIAAPGGGVLASFLRCLGSLVTLFFFEGAWVKFYIYFELSLVPIFLIVIG